MAVPENPDLTPWVCEDDWEERKSWFRNGDLVEFNRKGQWFNHWGMYLGNGLLAHVTRHEALAASKGLLSASTMASQALPSASSSAISPVAVAAHTLLVTCGDRILGPTPPELGRRPEDQGKYFVRTDDILTVAEGDEFRVNNVANNTVKYAQRSWPEIFNLVCDYQNGTYDYSALRRNCEHFVTFLRYRYGQPTAQAPTADQTETE